jgi:hypothetical protein
MLWKTNKEHVMDKWKIRWNLLHPEDIGNFTWQYLFTGGKQIRPTLFCELWNYLSPDSNINYELAFAIECIHVISIILDDTPWMDNAFFRRDKPTLHTIYSPKKTLLIAYELFYIVFTIWRSNKPEHITSDEWDNLLKDKLHKLIIGQWYDLEKKGNLIQLASLKTGVLFELITETIAVCLNLDRDFWCNWGNTLGILFQWVDDWHDKIEDTKQNNRNAFNESYSDTLRDYTLMWDKIQLSIGDLWFKTDFGIWMYDYFINSIPNIDLKNSNLKSLLELDYLFDIKYNKTSSHIFDKEEVLYTIDSTKLQLSFISGKELLLNLYKLINKLNTYTYNYDKMMHYYNNNNLWMQDEHTWNIDNYLL